MVYDDVEATVLQVVSSIAEKEAVANISHESRLKYDLGLDSLNMMELCVVLESAFNISIDEGMVTAKTVQDLIELVKSGGGINPAKAYNIDDYPMQKTEKNIAQLKKYIKLSKLLWKFKVSGIENIPPSSNYILCPNHQSHFDSLWVWAAIGIERINPAKICCLAKQEHLDSKQSRLGLTLLGGIPVDRSGNTVPAMKRALECITIENYNILIHPEGTRTLDGNIQEFKGGAAKLAIDANVPLIPVRIDGAWDISLRTESGLKSFALAGVIR